MIDKEFVPYEQALALKELGFDEPCFGKYDIYGVFDHKLFYHNHDADTILNCSAPTFSQVFRWFREKYQLFCSIEYSTTNQTDFVITINKVSINDARDEEYKTYEEAEQACLVKLIKIIKDGNK